MRLLPYFVARAGARSMDRHGQPGRALIITLMLPAAVVVFGFAGLALYVLAAVLFGIA